MTISAVALNVVTATTLANCNVQFFTFPVNVTTSPTGWAYPYGSYSSYSITPTMWGELTNITTTGVKTITGLNITLAAGYYYFVTQASAYTGTLAYKKFNSQMVYPAGFNSIDNSTVSWGFSTNWTINPASYVSGTPGIPSAQSGRYMNYATSTAGTGPNIIVQYIQT